MSVMDKNLKIQQMTMYFKESLKQFPLFPFQIDTNLINTRGDDDHMNQIEKWDENGIISLFFSNIAMNELNKSLEDFGKELKNFPKNIQVKIRKRSERISGKLFRIVYPDDEQHPDFKIIENILFPNGYQIDKEVNERNDVCIVFCACKYRDILLTNEGDSNRQPKGMLGNASALQTKVKIMRASDAVNMVQSEIDKLNAYAKIYSQKTGIPLELFD
jgi:hypothetical protein